LTTPTTSNGSALAIASPWHERHWRWLAGGIVLFTVVMGLSLVSSVWLAGADPVKYADLARSLARGEGYLFNNGPEAKHPPGFPVLLVPLFWFTSAPLVVARVMIVLTAGATLYLAGVILRRVLGAGVSLAALVCVAVSVHGWWSTQALVSEYPYAILQNVALLMLLRLTTSTTPRKRDALLFGLLTGTAILFRPAAVALIAAGAYTILHRRLTGGLRTVQAAGLAGLAVGLPVASLAAWRVYVAIFQIHTAAMPENVHILLRGYASSPGALIVETVKNMLSQGGGLVFGDFHPTLYPSVELFLWLALLLVWVPVPVALFVRGLWRAEPIWAFLCAYLSMIALWPLASGASARLCAPVTPFVVGLLLSSWRWLGGKLLPRHGAAAVALLIVSAVLAGQIAMGVPLWRKMHVNEDTWARRLSDLERIRDEFHPDSSGAWAHLNVRAAIYVFDMPNMMMEFSWSKDPEKWARELDDYRPDYIVVPTTPRQKRNTELFIKTLTEVRPTARCVAELEAISLYHIPPAG